MGSQRPVSTRSGCSWVQPTEPPLIERFVGGSWLDNSDPAAMLLKTWNGANWVVQDYLVPQSGISGYVNCNSTSLDRFAYANETISTLAGAIPDNRAQAGAFSSLQNGYMFGGTPGGVVFLNSIIRFQFSAESGSVISTTFNRSIHTAVGLESATTGYAFSDWYESAATRTQIEKLTFSGEAVAFVSATIVEGASVGASINAPSAGYAAGGAKAPGVLHDKIQKLTFSGESASTLTSTLQGNIYGGVGLESATNGYHCGGNEGFTTRLSTVAKLAFSGESTSLLASQLANGGRWIGASVNDVLRGYVASGLDNADVAQTRIDKLIFATDALLPVISTLSSANSSYYATGWENDG
jgi:hypothetical protein